MIKYKFDIHSFVCSRCNCIFFFHLPFGFLICHCVHITFYSFGCTAGNKTEFLESATLTEEEFQERPIINWDAILYVNRPTELWAVQLILALISLTEAMLLTYLGYKVSNNHLGHFLSLSLSIFLLFHFFFFPSVSLYESILFSIVFDRCVHSIFMIDFLLSLNNDKII